MKVESRQQGDVTVLTGIGELDAFHLPRLSEKIDEHLGDGRHKLVFNLRLLKSIDSSSFGYLVDAKKKCEEAGGNLVLAQPSSFVEKTLGILGLADYFEVFETEEAAAGAFGGDG